MKRFFTLLFLFFAISCFGQNLIPDPSAEDVLECPSSLGNIDIYTSSWQSFRGTPDYWNSCSTNIGLGWNNALGYQEPRTGNGYLGGAAYSTAFPAREYFGTQLLEPMEIGQIYFLSFYVSLAYKVSGGARIACNNIGLILLTNNYFDPDESGAVLNFSHLKVDTIISDTTNWIFVSGTAIADSAYTHVAYGNFFEDNETIYEYPFEQDNVGEAHYFYDDFCITTNLNGCGEYLSMSDANENISLKIWPNPTESVLHYDSDQILTEIRIFDMQGRMVYMEKVNLQTTGQLQFDLNRGIYLIEFISIKEKLMKRFVVK